MAKLYKGHAIGMLKKYIGCAIGMLLRPFQHAIGTLTACHRRFENGQIEDGIKIYRENSKGEINENKRKTSKKRE